MFDIDIAITFIKIVIIITKNNKNPPKNLLTKFSNGLISILLIIFLIKRFKFISILKLLEIK